MGRICLLSVLVGFEWEAWVIVSPFRRDVPTSRHEYFRLQRCESGSDPLPARHNLHRHHMSMTICRCSILPLSAWCRRKKKCRAHASQEALKQLAHHNLPRSGASLTGSPMAISDGTIARSQFSQCSSITSAIDRMRRQPGQPQKQSKYPARDDVLLLLLPVVIPSPFNTSGLKSADQSAYRHAAVYAARPLINTNYVDNNDDVNMIYVANFARVEKCKNPWAND